ncbi:Rv1733c family protein [Pseudonocardia ailaonensis]|uniref:Rv1733c family protein n=1 Tax=Pseudonocardia ailaonensis TaxID=367279 RepID=UPI003CD09909
MDERHPSPRTTRRRTDRLEDLVAVFLCAVGVLVVVLAAIGGVAANGAVVDRAGRESSERVRVQALVTALEGTAAGAGAGTRRAEVTWTAPDGTPRAGRLSVPVAAVAGSEVVVWLDRDGRQASAPTSPYAGLLVGVVVAAAGAVIGIMLLLGVWQLVRRATGRSNARAWEAGWAEVEPHWSGRTTTS